MPVALGAIDSHEMSDAGILEAGARLQILYVPSWAIEIRKRCILRLNTSYLHTLPNFVIRCEVSMVGVSLMNPFPADLQEAYKRILLRFLREALCPLVDRVRASKDYEFHREHDALVQVFRLCESPIGHLKQQNWIDILNYLGEGSEAAVVQSKSESLAVTCVQIVCENVFHLYPSSYHNPVMRFMYQLPREYQRLHNSSDLYTDGIAQMLLDALEAECPLPDWLTL